MPHSAMAWVVPLPAGVGVGAEAGEAAAGCLRDAVLGGPASGTVVDDGLRAGLLGELAGGAGVSAALIRAGHVDGRRRVLTGVVTVVTVLGLCLFRSEGYDAVLARVLALLPGVLTPGAAVPTGSALSQARTRLRGDPLEALFQGSAGAGQETDVPGVTWFGLELTVFDGTVVDLAATPADHHAVRHPHGGPLPTGAAGHPRLVRHPPGTGRRPGLIRGQRTATGRPAHRRVRAGHAQPRRPQLFLHAPLGRLRRHRRPPGVAGQKRRQVPPREHHRGLADGSHMVRLRESNSMLSLAGAPPATPPCPACPTPSPAWSSSTLLVTDRSGNTRGSRFRLLTTLPDHHAYPAQAIAALYAERWQAELAYYRLKVTLRGSGVRLRGQTPALARQEIWGLLIVYNALCDLATRTAVPRRRPRRDLLHRSPTPDPHPPGRPHLLPRLRSPAHRSHRRTDHRDRRPPPQPHRPTTHQPEDQDTTPDRTHPRRQLHHHHRDVKSTQSNIELLNLRAVLRREALCHIPSSVGRNSEEVFLGLMPYLAPKGSAGDSSMAAKQRASRRRQRWAAARPVRHGESWIA